MIRKINNDYENDENNRNSENNENEDEDYQYSEEEDDFEEDDEFEEDHDIDNKLNNRFESVKAFCNKNKKAVITSLIFFSVIIIIIPLFLIFGKNNKSASTELNSGNDESRKNEYVSVVAAEVGDENDPEDPQSKGGNTSEGVGTKMNASDLKDAGNNTSKGIDVSKHQGKIDWNAVAASGIEFAMIRVGYRTDISGIITEDLYARYNLQKATEEGIKVGVYFFSTATSKEEVLEEAAWTSNFISKYAITYPVAYNCEGFTETDSRMYGISNKDRTNYAIAFLNYIKNDGYEVMLYASKSELENSQYWDTSRISQSYKVWVAQYPTIPYPQTNAPSYSGDYAMWQCTNQGLVNGVNADVDINIACFKYDTVAEAKDPSGAINADNPELGITFSSVNDKVTAKELTNLRSLPSTSGDIVASITNGEFVTRIATGDNGWSKLEYNGQTVYALTRLLTDKVIETKAAATKGTTTNGTATNGVESGISFTAVSDEVTAKEETNLRTAPNTTSGTVVVAITNGTFCTRTGIGDNGWSRLVYNGQTVYAKTNMLTSEVKQTQAPTTEEEGALNEVKNMNFTPLNDKVTIVSTVEKVNLRNLPSTVSGVIIIELKPGEYVERTGISNEWSRLTYNGTTVYAATRYLTN